MYIVRRKGMSPADNKPVWQAKLKRLTSLLPFVNVAAIYSIARA